MKLSELQFLIKHRGCLAAKDVTADPVQADCYRVGRYKEFFTVPVRLISTGGNLLCHPFYCLPHHRRPLLSFRQYHQA